MSLFFSSVLVRYAISVDYKAAVAVLSVDYKTAVAVGVAMGLIPRISILLLSCIVDIFEFTIGSTKIYHLQRLVLRVCYRKSRWRH